MLIKNLNVSNHLEDLSVEGRIILKLILYQLGLGVTVEDSW